MKSRSKILNLSIALSALLLPAAALAQSSAPAPGSGGSFTPNPPNGIGWNPGPVGPGPGAPGPGWGSSWGGPWGGGWGSSPSVVVNIPIGSSSWQNSGTTNVVGVGYDAQGVWRTVPMTVSYSWNGVQYNVTVLNAWNPWTDMWNRGVDQEAYNTTYYLRGTYYDFYAPLTTGTYYFNL